MPLSSHFGFQYWCDRPCPIASLSYIPADLLGWSLVSANAYWTSLVVQWLRLCASTAGGLGSTPGWGNRIPHAAWPAKKTQTNKLLSSSPIIYIFPPGPSSKFWTHTEPFVYLERNESVCVGMLSFFGRVWLFTTLWTVAHQVFLSTGFSRQEYCSGLPFFSPTQKGWHWPNVHCEIFISQKLASIKTNIHNNNEAKIKSERKMGTST